MEIFLLVGIILLCTYIFGQVSFVIYSKSSYAKLRDAIISQGRFDDLINKNVLNKLLIGRLISMIPVLTVTTVMQGPGSSQNQFQPMPGAPPGCKYFIHHLKSQDLFKKITDFVNGETKQMPPAYTP